MPPNFFNYDDTGIAAFPEEGRILSNLTEEEWGVFLGIVGRRSFAAGQTVLHAGEADRTLYIIAAGSVDVIVDGFFGPRKIATITEGSVFGEMAFFDGAPRSATIVARESVDVLTLDRPSFERLAAWQPVTATSLLLDLGRILCARLRRLNKNA